MPHHTLRQVFALNHLTRLTTTFCFASCLLFVTCLPLKSQDTPAESSPEPTHALTLNEAVELALKNYPQIRAANAQVAAARSGVELARTAYLPRTELLWQANRATRNNVFGQFFPGSVPLPISGPVLGTNSGTSVWGTAAGFLFSWEPFDFGARGARVDVERAKENQSSAQAAVTQFDTAVAAADAFLTLVAALQSVRAATAGVERAQVLVKSVEAMVQNDLRPGADAARARAELAAAQNLEIQAEQSVEVQRVRLAEALGVAGNSVNIQPGALSEVLPPGVFPEPHRKNPHPFALVQSASIELINARRHELDRAYFPRFDFQAATYGRGSGALTDGRTLGGLNGLVPDVINWAVGFTARFQLFDLPSLRQKKAIERENQNVENARMDQVLQGLTAQAEKAKADLNAARRIAGNTPVQLSAARTAEGQIKARYEAGLATLVEVADAQRLLTQAETEDSIARLRVWRSWLAAAAAQGSLQPFLTEVRKQTPGEK
jgi:outer membrane protein TolC